MPTRNTELKTNSMLVPSPRIPAAFPRTQRRAAERLSTEACVPLLAASVTGEYPKTRINSPQAVSISRTASDCNSVFHFPGGCGHSAFTLSRLVLTAVRMFSSEDGIPQKLGDFLKDIFRMEKKVFVANG